MADSSTVARPYAKAIFEIARDAKDLQRWDFVLKLLASVARANAIVDFVSNPSVTPKQHVELLVAIVSEYKNIPDNFLLANFLSVLAENRRLLALSEIYAQFSELYAAFEKTIEVRVLTFAPFTKTQEVKLSTRLAERLQRNVTLKIEIDKSLKGGAIIQAGHLVFDASVGTKINKLGAFLAA